MSVIKKFIYSRKKVRIDSRGPFQSTSWFSM